MTNKKIWIGIAIVVLAVVAYLAYAYRAPQPKPTGGEAAGKINIDAVCEGALAYTTFPDAASADAFVADCKAGKHPEVIDHYKAQMGLGAGAQI